MAVTTPSIRILVVDDHIESGEALTLYLRTQGVDAQSVDSGDAAIGLIDDWLPDVVILDINMPDRDGFSTAAELRRSKRGSDFVIVALTALDEALVRRHAKEFDGYCRKGTRPSSLLTLLASFVVG
ncbi:response regulator [Cupriavidus pauculus]|uniref:Response regulator n=1 Tax=Cupriavidus pauculus TaxID=82633 RepID=A0A2N5CE05_9BURK|nr:response regulator [Cupriavidus pauculus]